MVVVLCGRVPTTVRLTGFVVLDVAEVTAAGRTSVQVLAAGRRLDGRDRILRRQREQCFRGLGRVTDPTAVAVVLMVMVVMAVVMLVMMVVMMVVAAVMFLATLDVFQLQIDHVLLSAAVGDLQVAVQVLVTEPVTAERLGGQIVPRLDRLDGAIIAAVSRRRLRLDRVLSRRGRGRMRPGGRHRVLVPVQRVRAQRRRVRRLAVLGHAVLVPNPSAAGRRALAYPLVRSVPIVHQVDVAVVAAARRPVRRRRLPVAFVRVRPDRVAPFLVALPAVRTLRLALCEHTHTQRTLLQL